MFEEDIQSVEGKVEALNLMDCVLSNNGVIKVTNSLPGVIPFVLHSFNDARISIPALHKYFDWRDTIEDGCDHYPIVLAGL